MAFLKYFCFNYNIDLDTALKKTPEKVDEKQLPKSTVMERSPTWGASPAPAVVVWEPWGEAPGQKNTRGWGWAGHCPLSRNKERSLCPKPLGIPCPDAQNLLNLRCEVPRSAPLLVPVTISFGGPRVGTTEARGTEGDVSTKPPCMWCRESTGDLLCCLFFFPLRRLSCQAVTMTDKYSAACG